MITDKLIEALHLQRARVRENEIHSSCPFTERHLKGSDKVPSFSINYVKGVYNCFGGETEVITRKGVFKIRDLVEHTHEIINGHGKWENVHFESYGTQQLVKVTLSSNGRKKEVYSTMNHEWVVRRFKNKVPTKDLRPGMYLEKIHAPIIEGILPADEGIVHGIVYGDGSCQKRKNGTYLGVLSNNYHYGLTLCTESKKSLHRFFERYSEYKDYYHISFTTDKDLKVVPDLSSSHEYILGFLAGYFATDGNCTHQTITLASSNKKSLLKVRDLCTSVGITTYPLRKQQRDLDTVFSGAKVDEDGTSTIFILSLVKSTIPDSFWISDKKPTYSSTHKSYLRYRVESIEITNKFEEVFCCETSTHSFALEGFILTGNCFSCGSRGSLESLVSELRGINPLEAINWLESIGYYQLDFIFEENLGLKAQEQIGEKVLPELLLSEFTRVDSIYETYEGIVDGRECVIFICRDIEGNLVGGTARSKEGRWHKVLWHANKKFYLMGEHEIKQDGTPMVIVEGPKDMIAIKTAGYNNVVALMGVEVSQYQVAKMILLADEFIIWLDKDDAGKRGTGRLIEVLEPVANVKYVNPFAVLTETEKDANNVLEQRGPESVLALIKEAKTFLEWELENL
jgi:5S rRNA maturation endonuclease (ribonuclease M5)